MIEIKEDLWTIRADARVITTNGQVRQDGTAVMGAGIAKAAARRYPDLSRLLGDALRTHGNRVHYFFTPTGRVTAHYDHVVTFPTKEHWRNFSEMSLVLLSARHLVELCDHKPWWKKIVMPRPGCGLGGLDWEDVRPQLAGILDDRFHVCQERKERT